jgi:oligopeptide transport system permease protein
MARDDSPRDDAPAVREALQGESLWQDAWRRLKKNRMAMVGFWITVVMSLSAILADVISPYDPEEQQRWLGAKPPGSEVLTLRNEMRMTVGETPARLDVPEHAAQVLGDGAEHLLRFEIQDEIVTPIRLVLDGDVIERIEARPRGKGISRPDVLEVPETDYLRDAETSARIAATELTKDAVAPGALLGGEGRRVVSLELVRRNPEDRYALDVTLDGSGAVASIAREGAEPLPTLTLRPTQVVAVLLDGEPLTHVHLLGTDQEGRDTLSRLIFGGRISLLVGLTATIVSLVVGVLYGAVAGYLGGRVDGAMMRIVDVLYGIPYLFLVILLLVAFGRSITILFVALGLVQWLTMARIVRGQVLGLKEKEFIDAAITVGAGPWDVLTRHLIPNTLGVVVVYTTLTVPQVILQESFLAFIGLTVEFDGRPLESWGALVNYGRETLGANGESWWLLLWPSIAMSVTLFSLNFLGDGLRDALDPQQRGRT